MGTHYRGTPDQVRALNAYVKLARAHTAVDHTINRRLAELGLTHSQFGALEALLHLGPMGAGTLARKILRSPGNLTTVLANLERRGLIRRERDHDDRRVTVVDLSDAGRALIQGYFDVHAERVRFAFSALSSEELGRLSDLLKALGRAQERPEPETLRAPLPNACRRAHERARAAAAETAQATAAKASGPA